MEAHSDPGGDEKAYADHNHIDDREGRNQIDCTGAPKRHQEWADDLISGLEQVDASRIVLRKEEKKAASLPAGHRVSAAA